jgi:hypothetical protein
MALTPIVFPEFLGTANFGQEDHDLQIFAKEIA